MKDEPIALRSYEDFGYEYANVIEGNAYNAFFEKPTMLSMLPDVKSKHILDAGCGPGAYIDWFLEQGAEVTGVDVSPTMLEIAKKKYKESAKFILHDLAKPMPFLESSSFDIILSSLSIHYILDLELVFSEFHRLLKAGGVLLLSTHHPAMEVAKSEKINYFSTELVEETWNTIGRPVVVRYYRRPISFITHAAKKFNFIIDELNEGICTPELKAKFPQVYDRLSKKPQFIFFRFRKQG